MQLYSYFRSSAAFRVRIALAIKGLTAEIVPVHLLQDGGQQHSPAYVQLNPSELVPTLKDQEHVLTQSLSILEYLEEQYPDPRLLPQAAHLRAQVRAFCLNIACDIHPLNNLRVLQYLTGTLKLSDIEKNQWYQHWIVTGLNSLEAQLQATAGKFCFGDQLTMADCCLIPQVYNAKRFQIDLSAYPLIEAVYAQCMTFPAFIEAAPEQQPDAA